MRRYQLIGLVPSKRKTWWYELNDNDFKATRKPWPSACVATEKRGSCEWSIRSSVNSIHFLSTGIDIIRIEFLVGGPGANDHQLQNQEKRYMTSPCDRNLLKLQETVRTVTLTTTLYWYMYMAMKILYWKKYRNTRKTENKKGDIGPVCPLSPSHTIPTWLPDSPRLWSQR